MSGMRIEDKLAKALGLEGLPRGLSATTDFAPVSNDVKIVRRGDEQIVIVGYLALDDDAEHADPRKHAGFGDLREFRSEAERDAFKHDIEEQGKLALVVDKYDHGNVHYSVANTVEYLDRRLDVAPSGVFVPCEDVQSKYREAVAAAGKLEGESGAKAIVAAMADAVSDSNVQLQEYSDWVNGEVYGAIVERWEYDPERGLVEQTEQDACWGFIGRNYAAEQLAEQLAGAMDIRATPAP